VPRTRRPHAMALPRSLNGVGWTLTIYVTATHWVLPSTFQMEWGFKPERFEALAKELRHIAKQLIHPENVASIVKQAKQLEAKAAQMRQAGTTVQAAQSSPRRAEA